MAGCAARQRPNIRLTNCLDSDELPPKPSGQSIAVRVYDIYQFDDGEQIQAVRGKRDKLLFAFGIPSFTPATP
jgi:hypothetical protein